MVQPVTGSRYLIFTRETKLSSEKTRECAVKCDTKWSHLSQGVLKWGYEAIKEMDLTYILMGWNHDLQGLCKPTCNLSQ